MIFSFLHVSMTLHAISPRLAIKTRLIFPEPFPCSVNVLEGSFSTGEDTEETAMVDSSGLRLIEVWI
jgi:hypothetical protein